MPYFKDFTFEAGNELRRGSRAGSYSSPLVPGDLIRHMSRTSSPSFGPLDPFSGEMPGGGGGGSPREDGRGLAPGVSALAGDPLRGGGASGVDDLITMQLRPSPEVRPVPAPSRSGYPAGTGSRLPPPAASSGARHQLGALGGTQPPPPPPVQSETKEARPLSPELQAAMAPHASGAARRAGQRSKAAVFQSPLASHGANGGVRVRTRP